MNIDFASEKPIFLQISDGIEDAVLSGAFPEEAQIPSITEFSVMYKINPATANKGINLLVERGLVYKRRGIGMFVAAGAVDALRKRRHEQFIESYVDALVAEAKRLGISSREVIKMIEGGFEK